MIFDSEADGLLDTVTKVHVLAYKLPGKEVEYTHDYDEMRRLLTSARLLIGHNIITYDIPMLEKVLGIKIEARPIDTLALSWYLNHDRVIHGLDSYGKDYGVPKPKIDDWENLSPEEYAHRCVEDVKINTHLWRDLSKKLLGLYDSKQEANRLIDYLSFKMDCLREQENSGWHLDEEKARASLEDLEAKLEVKLPELVQAMPNQIKTVDRTRPAKPFKKDGTLSVTGAKWFSLLREHNLPENYSGAITVPVREEPPNPSSNPQIKDWLFSLGWEPSTFKFVKDDNGERQIPQVRVDGKEGKELCPSVKKLIPDNPAVEVLDGITVLNHRISIFKGFLDNVKDGKLVAGAAGFTNTLRLKHRVLVNLPGVGKPYGADIRGCLIAPEGHILCGSDMNSLEDNTKRHYMYPYDPDYVEEMSKAGFDPHLDLAKHAGAVDEKAVTSFLNGSPGFEYVKAIRTTFKVANYSCIYGVGPPKLSRELSIPLKQAKDLINAYWERNWAIKQLAEDTEVKNFDGGMWLFNPVSRFWYSLRYEKDIFSTLNQSTGVYCFDKWIEKFRSKRKQLTGQFHDEIILRIKEGQEEKCKKLLLWAIDEVNKELKLNVTLGVDIQFGKTYADIH